MVSGAELLLLPLRAFLHRFLRNHFLGFCLFARVVIVGFAFLSLGGGDLDWRLFDWHVLR